jgi:hypothetical protein
MDWDVGVYFEVVDGRCRPIIVLRCRTLGDNRSGRSESPFSLKRESHYKGMVGYDHSDFDHEIKKISR